MEAIREDALKLHTFITSFFQSSEDQDSVEEDKRSTSIRWVAIFIGLTVFFYESAVPFLYSKATVYRDLRFGLLVWLFTAAVTHTPMGSSEVEDHPTFLFLSVFILLSVVTHLTLAAFTVLHHVVAGLVQIVSPKWGEMLWVPALRSVRSFKTILKASLLLSGSLSFLFAYCGTVPEQSCTLPLHHNQNAVKDMEDNDIDICDTEETVLDFNKTMVGEISELVCSTLLPKFGDYWAVNDGDLNFKLFGMDLGTLSLLESPIGLLWISGIAIWATYYTLRRTKRINQTLHERAKRKKRAKSLKERSNSEISIATKSVDSSITDEDPGKVDDDENTDDEASEDEYLPPTSQGGEVGDLPPASENVIGRKKQQKPKFLPMAEWYSLALTKTAFQVLISMKLFLGRFDMRTMQAAIDARGEKPQHQNQHPTSSTSSTSSCLDEEFERDDEEDAKTTRSGSFRSCSHCSSSQLSLDFDSRYADLDELWIDWLADTGDGGDPTYMVARTVAQPELELLVPNLIKPGDEETKKTKKMEKLKRGDLLILGGDLAYPTPSRQEYDERLFVPFEDALQPPPSYHRDDISMHREEADSYNLTSQLSFVRAPSIVNMGNLEGLPTSRSLQHETRTSEDTNSIRGRRGSRDQFHDHRSSSSRTTLSSEASSDASSIPMKKQESSIFRIGGGSTDSLVEQEQEEFRRANKQKRHNLASLGKAEEEEKNGKSGPEEEERKKWIGPPCAFAIPGNHDWFDGLDTFMQCICYRDWLGGWRLPQTKSYFALQLPHGWWMFGLDFALEDDIDGLQYQYFASIASRCLKEDDQVILCCHEPTWVLDAYLNYPHPENEPIVKSSKNVKQLMRRYLRGKVALRIAGDIHNYMRHDVQQPLNKSAVRAGASPVLVTSGGGGAFLHPTHPFPDEFKETGAHYKLVKCYPSKKQSRIVGMQNLGQGFRLQNWKFDFVGSTVYFLIVFSFFPRCNLSHIMDVRFYPNGLIAFFMEILVVFGELWSDAIASLLTVLFVLVVTYSFADYHYGAWRQLVVGSFHGLLHVFCAITLFLLLELTVEVAIQDGLAGQGYDSFFQTFQAFEKRTMPKSWWTSGKSAWLLQFMLRLFDLPENMATTRVKLCTNGTSFSSLSRFDLATYYGGNFLYLSTITADFCAMIIGLYLYVCVNALHWHWNEAFSSIRSKDFKSFMRFHIDSNGDLHAYSIGIDRTPTKWRPDHRWQSTWTRLLRKYFDRPDAVLNELDPSIASYGADVPSKWVPAYSRRRKQQQPKVVDYFCVPRKRRWLKPRRGNSLIGDDWWDAFTALNQQKMFHRTPTIAQQLNNSFDSPQARQQQQQQQQGRYVSKSQSPVGNRQVSSGNLMGSMTNVAMQKKKIQKSKTSGNFSPPAYPNHHHNK